MSHGDLLVVGDAPVEVEPTDKESGRYRETGSSSPSSPCSTSNMTTAAVNSLAMLSMLKESSGSMASPRSGSAIPVAPFQ